jgi:glutamyl-tRNA synthetase
MTSTPMHLAVYKAFNWEPPAFAHVPLLTDQNGQKLSKRNMDTDIFSFREKLGIFPDTLTNFVALLGWSHDRRSDVMDLQELIDHVRKIPTLSLTFADILPVYDEIYSRKCCRYLR